MFPEYTTLNLLLIAGLSLFLSALNPFRMRWRLIVLMPLIVIQLQYVSWRYHSTMVSFEWHTSVLWQYLYFSTELLVVVYVAWQCVTLIFHLDRTQSLNKQCIETPESHNTESPSVDLFIPTYSEPVSILSATIAAAKRDSYANLTIWICDDSERDWLSRLCAHEGVRYLRRPITSWPRNKAGNLHWAIPHGQAEYIICLDADFQAEAEMTTLLTSLFTDKSIGLVQAPQYFRNLDPIQRNLLGGKAWTEEQRFFFDIGLPSRDAWNNALCVGSCWATRRTIINKLGGYPTDSIVEDVYYGYCVKSLGWNTAYLNCRVATGLAALDAPSYIQQRTRWCRGAMALLSAPYGPIRAKGLSLTDRLFYLDISFYWLTHLHLLLLLIAPILYGFFGYTVFHCTTEELMTILIPKNILFAAVFYWISQGRCMPIITQIQKTFSIFSVTAAIGRGLVNPGYSDFTVTAKEASTNGRTIHWNIALPFILIGLLTVLSIAHMQTQSFNQFDWSDYTVFNTLLSAYTLISVFLCCLICVDNPRKSTTTDGYIPQHGSLLKTTLALTNRTFL